MAETKKPKNKKEDFQEPSSEPSNTVSPIDTAIHPASADNNAVKEADQVVALENVQPISSTNMSQGPTSYQPTMQHSAPSTKNRNKLIIGIVIGAILLLCACIASVIGLAAVFGNTSANINKTADIFFRDIKNGDIDKAYNDTAQGFKNVTTRSEFKQFVDKIDLKRYESYRFASTRVSSNTAQYDGYITIDGSEQILKMNFERSGTKWKVLYISIR